MFRPSTHRVPVRTLMIALCLAVLNPASGVGAGKDSALFVSAPSDSHVRQGALGTCYLHALLAAVARHHPEWLTRGASETKVVGFESQPAYRVDLEEGRLETVFQSDAIEARSKGYDESIGGLWTVVFLRAYGQSVLRDNLIEFVKKQPLLDEMLKGFVVSWLEKDQLVTPAYDRAVRGVVSQSGEVDAAALKEGLRKELTALSVPPTILEALLDLAEQAGFISQLETMVKQDPEVFGAWKIIGHGGVSARAAKRLFGLSCEVLSPGQLGLEGTKTTLTVALDQHKVVIGSGHDQSIENHASWFSFDHAYAILGIDGDSVELRNPWTSTPESFKVPLSEAQRYFDGIQVCGK